MLVTLRLDAHTHQLAAPTQTPYGVSCTLCITCVDVWRVSWVVGNCASRAKEDQGDCCPLAGTRNFVKRLQPTNGKSLPKGQDAAEEKEGKF